MYLTLTMNFGHQHYGGDWGYQSWNYTLKTPVTSIACILNRDWTTRVKYLRRGRAVRKGVK